MSQPVPGFPRLLIATVGGSPGPVKASIQHWEPDRVHFVTSQETQQVARGILRELEKNLSAGAVDWSSVSNPDDLKSCLRDMRELDVAVRRWRSAYEGAGVIVDLTGGTKTMAAALALIARPWPGSIWSYVGGRKRGNGGAGMVVEGTEFVVSGANPWDALGYQAVEEFSTLFNRYAFAAAKDLAIQARNRSQDPARKRALTSLVTLAELFDAWDRFDHEEAGKKYQALAGQRNDLREALGRDPESRLWEILEALETHLVELREDPPSWAHVCDLIANAQRRMVESRWDDATARLYRAIEAIAQVILKEHGIPSTARVRLEDLPEELRTEFHGRVGGDGPLSLALQQAWKVALHFEPRRKPAFKRHRLGPGKDSPLNERNQSILAHGFRLVSPRTCQKMMEAALDLAGLTKDDLLQFPTIELHAP